MKLTGLNWDFGNFEKVKKHGLSHVDIEEFLLSDPFILTDDRHNAAESRYIAFGKFKLKYLFVAFTIRAVEGELKIRPISARYANKREVEKFYGKSR